MKEWYSISDLLATGDPYLTSQQAWYQFAERHGWHSEEHKDRVRWVTLNGGEARQYHTSLFEPRLAIHLSSHRLASEEPLPLEVSDEYAKRQEHLWNDFMQASEGDRAKAQFKLDCLQQIEALKTTFGITTARRKVSRQFKVHLRTLQNWADEVQCWEQQDWLAALCPERKSGRPQKDCAEEIVRFFAGVWLTDSKPSMAEAHRITVEAAKKHGWGKVPHQKTLRSRIEDKIGAAGIVAVREGKKALDDIYPHLERDKLGLHAMHTVNADGHVLDLHVEWEDGTVSRPVLVGFQDVYSSMILSYRLGKTENTELIRLACADMIRTFGIPEICYFDNGRAFASQAMTGQATDHRYRGRVKDDEELGILGALGVDVRFVRPGHGQSKPIERAWGDLVDAVAKTQRLLGPILAIRPAISRKATVPALSQSARSEPFWRMLLSGTINGMEGAQKWRRAGAFLPPSVPASKLQAPLLDVRLKSNLASASWPERREQPLNAGAKLSSKGAVSGLKSWSSFAAQSDHSVRSRRP